MAVIITSLKLGDLEVEIDDGGEGVPLNEILEQLNIRQVGNQFVVNNDVANITNNPNIKVRNNDRVELIDNPKAGR